VKKVGEMMKEMGFKKNSSDDAKRAFFQYLVRTANQAPIPFAHKAETSAKANAPEQLSFDLLGNENQAS